MTEIIIASSTIDKANYSPVADNLSARGHNVFLYLSDRVTSGDDLMSLTIEPDSSSIEFSYNGESKNLRNIHAAWYRRPKILGLNYTDKAKQLSMEGEINTLQNAVWAQIPDRTWLNSPYRMNQANEKIGQLAMASSLGFIVPKTVIANNWEDISSRLSEGEIIVKMANGGTLYDGVEEKSLFTTRLSADMLDDLQSTQPFPAIYQGYLEKSREWRVTVVGEDVFEASIYTVNKAKDDWRKHQLFKDRVRFKKESLPDDVKEKCIQFLGEYGLRFGAFDFVEDYDGQITFLECNPNGQYMWLEDSLGFPISDCITNELIKIAES